MNLKNSITIMGSEESGNQEYADRMWNGVVGDFYQHRWRLFFDHLEDSLHNRTDPIPFATVLNRYDEAWVRSDTRYRVTRSDADPVALSRQLYQDFQSLLPGRAPPPFPVSPPPPSSGLLR